MRARLQCAVDRRWGALERQQEALKSHASAEGLAKAQQYILQLTGWP